MEEGLNMNAKKFRETGERLLNNNMSEEINKYGSIKEIIEILLRELKDGTFSDCDEEFQYICYDYINNLQKENEELKNQNTKLYKKDIKIINELKEELEATQEKWNKDKQWSECRTKEWLEYKSRNEKAIEYIQNNKLYTFKYDDEELFEITTDKIAKDGLLKILGGDE